MSKVWVPQEPLKRDRITGEVVNKFNLADARQFGEIIFLVGWGEATRVMAPYPLFKFVYIQLMENYTDDDYILPVGNPAVEDIVISIIARKYGRYRLLWWDKETRDYKVVTIEIGRWMDEIDAHNGKRILGQTTPG
jgi:hypothetical protein